MSHPAEQATAVECGGVMTGYGTGHHGVPSRSTELGWGYQTGHPTGDEGLLKKLASRAGAGGENKCRCMERRE